MTYFVLRTENARDRFAAAWRFACEFLQLGKSVKVEISELLPKRSIEQNARLWALLTDVSQQVEWSVDGKMRRVSPEWWKDIFTAALKQHQHIAQGIDGGFVMLGTRTSRMTVAEMVDLQTLIEAFGAEHNVQWSDPHFSEGRRAA